MDDVNGGVREGVGRIPMSSLPDRRVSSAAGYLDAEVRNRPNLRILAETEAVRLAGEGPRVDGVEIRRGGGTGTATAGETILCAGSFRSPALLMRSGFGPPARLRALGIAVRAALPGVGGNLHDHPTFAAAAHLKPAARQPPGLRAHANAGLFYSSGLDGCPPLDMYMPIANKVSWHAVGRQIGALFVVVMKPFSRGRVTLVSPDPGDWPEVRYDAFGDERDLLRAMAGMRFALDLLSRPAVEALTSWRFGGSFSERTRALDAFGTINRWRAALGAALLDGPGWLRDSLLRRAVAPGIRIDDLAADDSALEDWLRDAMTGFFHPVGTCRMGGPDDPETVAGPGGEGAANERGLRVADASVMPEIVRATTNLTAIMIGEKIARAILDETA